MRFLRRGFKEEGRIRQAILREGKFVDRVYMGLLESEYREAVEQGVYKT